MKTIIINLISGLLLAILMGCSSVYVSEAQLSTVRDSTEQGGFDDSLGANTDMTVESAPSYSVTGGGGL